MDAPKRFINIIIPMNKCNLKCEYCYIAHLPEYYSDNCHKLNEQNPEYTIIKRLKNDVAWYFKTFMFLMKNPSIIRNRFQNK